MEKKIDFVILDWEGKCNNHPDSKFLGIEDNGQLNGWCLECIYKFLLRTTEGLWDVEHKEKS